jgi:hypothetical protein
MKWKSWLTVAVKYKLCIDDWPVGVPPPGPDFNLKTLNMAELTILTSAFRANMESSEPSEDPQPVIVRWQKGLHDISDGWDVQS